MIEVLFAPDWRSGVPYQTLLADALAACDVRVSFLEGYKRVFPLARLIASRRRSEPFDVLHLHWPEAYYPRKNDGLDWFRAARFSTDLALATRDCALVTTAHNLHAHNRAHEPFARWNMRAAFQRSSAIIAHSGAARDRLIATYALPPQQVHVAPHGDLSVTMPPLIERGAARAQLHLGDEPLCLMFGTVEPYKGLEDVLRHWREAGPAAHLAIVGRPHTAAYGTTITQACRETKNVICKLDWLSDHDLALWLSAANVAIFNYRAIFTSGAATLARSLGLPLLLPARLETIDLDEPSPRVYRFESFASDFADKLHAALAVGSNFAEARAWREATDWTRIAAQTARIYREVIA